MIVDTHVHYVEPPSGERPHDAEGTPAEHLSVDTLVREATALGIERIVQVTPSIMGYDNRYGLEGVRRYPSYVLGVFGRFDPLAANVTERLQNFMSQSGMLGVRIQLRKGTPAENWLRELRIDSFLCAAQEQGVPVSIYAINQPRELRIVARRFPALRIINEHMTLHKGSPSVDSFAQWSEALILATEPNVWTKVSFFPEAAPEGERFPFPTSLQRFKQLYETAGPVRLIWGSNYPPAKRACSYGESLDFVRTEATFLNDTDREQILGANFLAEFVERTHSRVNSLTREDQC